MLYAVIVGIDKYRDPSIPDLHFAASDATALAELCEASGYANDIDVRLVTNEDATRERVLDLLGTEIAVRAGPRDTVLFYFAGHGSPETARGIVTASRFLACHDTKREGLFATAIDVGVDLKRVAQRFNSRLAVFMLDACFSGYSGGRGFTGPTFDAYRSDRRAGLSLASIDMGQGIVYMAAAGDSEVAWEDERLAHGIFSYHVLACLRETTDKGFVSIANLYDAVYSSVRDFSRDRQHPVLSGSFAGAALPAFGERKG